MVRRQQHVVIQLGNDLLKRVPQRNEVDDVVVFIEITEHVDFDMIVMAVQPLADITVERNEMCSTEDHALFAQPHVIVFGQSISPRLGICVASRSANEELVAEPKKKPRTSRV